MKINIEVELKPFQIPTYVLAVPKDGEKYSRAEGPPKYHVRDLDAKVLEALCDEFKREVFKKAGKKELK